MARRTATIGAVVAALLAGVLGTAVFLLVRPSQAAPPDRSFFSARFRLPTTDRWSPPAAMPAPQERLTGREWEKRFAALQADVSIKALEADTRPEFSLRILRVVPETQAAELGIQPGDHMATFDKGPILGTSAFATARAERPGTLGLWSPKRGLHDASLKAGRMGLQYVEDWRPELAYLRSRERDPKWDAFVTAAAAGWLRDDEAAETALYHAHRAGYRGWLLPAVMTMLTFDHGRPAECMDWGWFARESTPAPQRAHVLSAFAHSAVLVGQSDWGRQIIRDFPEYRIEMIELGRHDAVRGEPTPCQGVGDVPPVPTVEGLDPNGGYTMNFLSRGKPCPFNFTPPKGGAVNMLGPAAANAHFLVQLRWSAAKPEHEQYPPQVRMHLVDASEGSEESLVMAIVKLREGTMIQGYDLANLHLRGAWLGQDGEHRIEAAARGRWCELRIDNRCVYLGAVPDRPDRKLVCRLELWNIAGAVTRIEVRHLADAAVARPAPKPPAASPATPKIPEHPELAWYHRALVEGYLKHGRRSETWDAEAIAALGLAGPFLVRPMDESQAYECWAASGRALALGCDDPAVYYVHARASEATPHTPYGELDREYHRAAAGLRSSAHAPALRCAAVARASRRSVTSCLTQRKQEAYSLSGEALDLLRVAAADRESPTSLLVAAMMDLARTFDDAKEGFDTVFAAMERARPGSAASRIFKGLFYTDYAWDARGSDWARSVSDRAMALFRERLAIAAEAFEEAWKLDPSEPAAPARIVKVAAGHEKTRAKIDVWIRRALKADANNVDACRTLLWLLMPRWFGSHEQLQRTGSGFFEMARNDDLRPVMAHLLVDAHEKGTLSSTFAPEDDFLDDWIADDYWREPEIWEDVKEVYGWILKKQPESAFWRSRYAYYACKCARWAEASEQFDALGERVVPEVFGGARQMSDWRSAARAALRK